MSRTLVLILVIAAQFRNCMAQTSPAASEMFIAEKYESAGRIDRATEHFRSALSALSDRPPFDTQRDAALGGVIRTLARRNKHRDLIELLEKEIHLVKRHRLVNDFDFVLYHRWIGEGYNQLQMPVLADSYFAKAISLADQHFGANTASAVSFRIEPAQSDHLSGRLDKAEGRFREILEGSDRKGRGFRGTYARALRGLASVLRSKGREDEGAKLDSRAHEIEQLMLPKTPADLERDF